MKVMEREINSHSFTRLAIISLLATAAVWVRIQTYLKIQNERHNKGVGNTKNNDSHNVLIPDPAVALLYHDKLKLFG
jgi:hypothetical protein